MSLRRFSTRNILRHAEIAEWVPVGWSPERFDLELADKLVAKHRPEPGRPRASKSKSSRDGPDR
jgi:hypothetical protein